MSWKTAEQTVSWLNGTVSGSCASSVYRHNPSIFEFSDLPLQMTGNLPSRYDLVWLSGIFLWTRKSYQPKEGESPWKEFISPELHIWFWSWECKNPNRSWTRRCCWISRVLMVQMGSGLMRYISVSPSTCSGISTRAAISLCCIHWCWETQLHAVK